MLDYTDPEGFSISMHRTEEDGVDAVDIVTTNPAGPRGWRTGGQCRVPVKLFMDAVKGLSGGVDEVMRIVTEWYVAVNDGAGYDGGDLVTELERAGFQLAEVDDE